MIKDDYKFIVKHMDRASSLQLFYQHVWEPNKRSTNLFDEKFILLSGVSGLFLEESLTSRVFRIRNYATKQVLYLPYAHEGTKTMSLFLIHPLVRVKWHVFIGKRRVTLDVK